MLNIPDKLKQIYRNDRVPIVRRLAYKELTLFFPELDLIIGTDRIVDDTFELQESLCSTDDLTLGACEGSILKLTVANLIQDLSGQEFILTQIVNGTYTMPLGTYRVDSCKKQNDLWFREIVAYNSMIRMNTDVSAWYNSLTWPQTVKSMRESLISYLGLECEEQTITNDTITLENTINPSGLVARDILSRLCEINAGFGQITRENKFKVVQLSGLGLYPSESLYPSEDLFPSESGEYVTAGYETTEYEEYIVESITSITIREDDGDFGTTAGVEGNPYIIEGNYLLFGKSSAEMQTIADNILLQVKNKFYRPHNTIMMGLPYMEVGDSVNVMTDSDAVESFIFKRRLKGIQSLTDEISATGNRKRDQQVGLNTQIKQLKGKTLRIQKNIDMLSIDMSDMEEGLQSQITQTAGQLQAEITDTKNDLQGQIILTSGSLQTQITDNKNNTNSQITQLSNSINLKVSKGDVSSQLSIEPGQVTISGNRLVVNSTNFKLDSTGNADFSGKISGGTMNINNNFTVSANGDFYARSATFGGDSYTTTINSLGIYVRDSSNNELVSRIYANGIETDIFFCKNAFVGNKAVSVSGHTHSTDTLPATVVDSSYIQFISGRAAGYNWCLSTFQQISSSDVRLKHNFKPLSEIPMELFMKLKPYQYEFKNKWNPGGISFGFVAQEVETAFKEFGLNPYDYNLIEITDSRSYTDEGSYILDGKVHRINYENFHAWNVMMTQRLIEKVEEHSKLLADLIDKFNEM